jgi:hypothetical protein
MTDSNIGSVIAAYVITGVAYIVYAISLWVRRRNTRRGAGSE